MQPSTEHLETPPIDSERELQHIYDNMIQDTRHLYDLLFTEQISTHPSTCIDRDTILLVSVQDEVSTGVVRVSIPWVVIAAIGRVKLLCRSRGREKGISGGEKMALLRAWASSHLCIFVKCVYVRTCE